MSVNANDIYKAPADVWAKLAALVPDNEIAWRQDGKPITRDGKILARFVCYIEAGFVRQRLDTIVPGEWDMTLMPLGNATDQASSEAVIALKCRLQVLGVVREGVGQGRDYKSAATDAFKRAAQLYGLGHELSEIGSVWVELDGDSRYAKPLEDPGEVYRKKLGGAASRATGERQTEDSKASSAPAAPAESGKPARALDEESCPKCGGKMWDNRLTKRNPRAPDFKCRDRSCDGTIWPPKPGGQKEDEPGEPQAWAPLPGAPLIPDDADLPF
jgi:hypothetical protein